LCSLSTEGPVGGAPDERAVRSSVIARINATHRACNPSTSASDMSTDPLFASGISAQAFSL
jgi:hypothetical protein